MLSSVVSTFTPLDRPACPAFPTELVFALDISEDVRAVDFERQRSALLSLLDDIAIAESNCPTGARVTVVAYSAQIKYLIRFQDFRYREKLKEAVKNILQEKTNRRFLGASMRFVGRNVFKHTRAGIMMRKVAVFFSSGSVQDLEEVATAVWEYRARDISLAIISTINAPPVRQALEVGLVHTNKGTTHLAQHTLQTTRWCCQSLTPPSRLRQTS